MNKRMGMIIGIAAAAIVLVGLYLIYLNVFVNKHRLDLVHNTYTTSEYRNIAAESSIMPSYMWSRVEKILKDGDYIMSAYMLEGRLATQDAEPSGRYLLTDQSLLLLKYIAEGDRISARNLVGKINEDFRMEDGSYRAVFTGEGEESSLYTNRDELAFLEAYIEYYSAYGNSDDMDNIRALVDIIFDGDGMIRSESLSGATYSTSENVSSVMTDEDIKPTFDTIYGAEGVMVEGGTAEEDTFDYEGVRTGDINLELLGNLERNKLIPEGTTARYEEIVTGALASPDIPYYAYAYTKDQAGNVVYVYSTGKAATISVSESLRTMLNLARVGLLPQNVYSQFKTNLINDSVLLDSYYIATGLTGGSEIQSSYVDLLALAKYQKDTDLFRTVSRIISIRVATKQQSRALYLIFRNTDDRYVFFGEENLKAYLVINGTFAV
ncbi:MAG: hypothetical protein IKE53_09235 [Clostridiales bacterium]|nr:hypothetical protein [Clostridiales bacterium]